MKVEAEGLQNRYQESKEFAVHIRMIAALAFVPLRDVVRAFEELQEHMSREVDPMLFYFEDSSGLLPGFSVGGSNFGPNF